MAQPTDGTDSQRWGSPFVVLWLAFAVLMLYPGEVALVGPLRSNGTPMRLIGMLALLLVVAGLLRRDTRIRARPVVAVVLVPLALTLVSWGTAHLRALTLEEAAAADRFVLQALAGTGLTLLGAAVVTDLRRAHALLGALGAGAVLAVLVGGLQFIGVIDSWSETALLPGLTTIAGGASVVDRLGFARVAGTSGHALEYSVALAVALPLLIHLALHASSRLGRRAAGLAVAAVALGLPLGFSRTGLIALGVVLLVYMAFLTSWQQIGVAIGTVVTVVAGIVLVPSVVGAFRQLFASAPQDNSIQGRLLDYPRVIAQFQQSPWVGNGPRYDPDLLAVLDNQWLGTLVRDGIVGVIGFAVLMIGGFALAVRASRRAGEGSAGRSLNGALAAGLAALAVAAATFDLMAFQQVAFLTYLLLGLVGVGSSSSRASTTSVSTAGALT